MAGLFLRMIMIILNLCTKLIEAGEKLLKKAQDCVSSNGEFVMIDIKTLPYPVYGYAGSVYTC